MCYTEFSDQELLQLLRQRKQGACTEIYNRYWEKLLLIAWNHSRDEQIAQDIVQEVLIDLWEKHYNFEINNLMAFLVTSVKFKVFKQHQKEYRRSLLLQQNYIFDDISLEEEKIDARFLSDFINGIVENMPERCRLVFHCSRNLGFKNAEIAEHANITKKSVENTLNRALKIIRSELKNLCIPFLIILKVFLHILR